MTRKKRKISKVVQDGGVNHAIHHKDNKCDKDKDTMVQIDKDGPVHLSNSNEFTGLSSSSIPIPIRNTDRLYASQETLACSMEHGCVPCAYKIGCFDVALDKEFCRACPNQRPEQCPRASHMVSGKPDDSTTTNGGSVLGIRSGMSILTVGDGDFSFSLGLARRLIGQKGGKDERENTWIVATSYEKKATLRQVYPQTFDDTLSELEHLGVNIAYEVDATRIRETLPPLPKGHPTYFHRIAWNFPCTAIARGQDGQNKEIEDNKKLVQGFVESARRILSASGDGELYICHKTKPPYNQWNLEEEALCKQQGDIQGPSVQPNLCIQDNRTFPPQSTPPLLYYAGRIILDKLLVPPYTPRKALDKKSFPCHDACFYVFAQQAPQRRQSKKRTTSFDDQLSIFQPTIPRNKEASGDDMLTPLVKICREIILSIRRHHIRAATSATGRRTCKKRRREKKV